MCLFDTPVVFLLHDLWMLLLCRPSALGRACCPFLFVTVLSSMFLVGGVNQYIWEHLASLSGAFKNRLSSSLIYLSHICWFGFGLVVWGFTTLCILNNPSPICHGSWVIHPVLWTLWFCSHISSNSGMFLGFGPSVLCFQLMILMFWHLNY